MPMYEYTCRDCKIDFETLLMGNETAECPSCHGEQLDKRFSVPGVAQLSVVSPSPGGS